MTATTDTKDPKQGRKFDSGKRKLSLLPTGVLNETLDVLLFGASKYAEDNWKYVPGARKRYYDALYRHVDSWWSGEKTDPETGKHHLAHAVCCAMFLMWFDLSGQDAVEEKTVGEEKVQAAEVKTSSFSEAPITDVAFTPNQLVAVKYFQGLTWPKEGTRAYPKALVNFSPITPFREGAVYSINTSGQAIEAPSSIGRLFLFNGEYFECVDFSKKTYFTALRESQGGAWPSPGTRIHRRDLTSYELPPAGLATGGRYDVCFARRDCFVGPFAENGDWVFDGTYLVQRVEPSTSTDSVVQEVKEDAPAETKPLAPTPEPAGSNVLSRDFWVGIPNRIFGKGVEP